MNKGRDIWIATLEFLFKHAMKLVDYKNEIIRTSVDKTQYLTDEEVMQEAENVNIITDRTNESIDEICKLIDCVYKYRYKNNNSPFGVDK